MLYHASTMLNAFGFYYAQNYAGIIRQGLPPFRSFGGVAGDVTQGVLQKSCDFAQWNVGNPIVHPHSCC